VAQLGGAPPGNTNQSKGKPWADAIKRALARRADGDFQDINKLADTLLNKAAEGDLGALKELGDRLDGKPAQTIAGDPDAPQNMVISWAKPQQ
jgi:hypothetical protein